MAQIFSGSSNYSGASSPTTGDGIKTVLFKVSKNGYSKLTIFIRESGSGEYIPLIEMNKPGHFKFDSSGLQYYAVWERIIMDSNTVTASLNIF